MDDWQERGYAWGRWTADPDRPDLTQEATMAYRPITDMWLLCRGKTGYYGGFPAGFLERARYLLGVQLYDPVLHVCGGKVKEYQSGPMKCKGLGPNDRTVDLDPDLNPDFHLDVRRIGVNSGDVFPYWAPVGPDKAEGITIGMHDCSDEAEAPFSCYQGSDRRPWAAALIDRPYTGPDAENYVPGAADYPSNLNDLLRRTLSITRIGGRVGVIDYIWPRPPREGVTLIACIGVTVGWGNRIRCFSVYERTCYNPLEYNINDGERDEHDEMMETETPEPQLINVDTNEVLTEEDDDTPLPPGTGLMMAAPEDVEPSPSPSAATLKKRKRRKRAGLTDGFSA